MELYAELSTSENGQANEWVFGDPNSGMYAHCSYSSPNGHNEPEREYYASGPFGTAQVESISRGIEDLPHGKYDLTLGMTPEAYPKTAKERAAIARTLAETILKMAQLDT